MCFQGYCIISAGTKNTKNQISISDEIISKPTVDLGKGKENSLEMSDQLDNKVRKRHKNKPQKDHERTLLIANNTCANSQNQNHTGANISSQNGVNNLTENSIQSSNSYSNKVLSSDRPEILSGGQKINDGRSEADQWLQNQQALLESALKQYPKGTDQRWEKIAKHVPGKTKVTSKG